MKKVLIAGAVALALVAAPAAVSAVPFTGQVDYTGVHTADNADLNVATQSSIDVNFVVIATDAFAAAGIAVGDSLVHASPIVYRPSGAPYSPLWSHAGSGVSFTLNTLSIVFSAANQLNLTGSGVFSGGGFDDTEGTWNMTLNNAGGVSGSFSSSSSVVPEPAMLALLGLGLIGVGRRYMRR